MTGKVIKGLSLILSLGGVAVSLLLVYNEFINSGFCPRFLDMPACIVVLGVFCLSAVASLFWGRLAAVIKVFSAVAGLIPAVLFSYRTLSGVGVCPVFMGVPLCFVSLATFAVLLILGLFSVRKA